MYSTSTHKRPGRWWLGNQWMQRDPAAAYPGRKDLLFVMCSYNFFLVNKLLIVTLTIILKVTKNQGCVSNIELQRVHERVIPALQCDVD